MQIERHENMEKDFKDFNKDFNAKLWELAKDSPGLQQAIMNKLGTNVNSDYMPTRRKGKMLHTYEIIKAVEAEFKRIDTQEKKFHSDHEAWAVPLEEVEELDSEIDSIKHSVNNLKNKIFMDWGTPGKLEDLDYIYEHAVLAAAEAVQVAAVATKFIKLKEKRVTEDADNN